MSEHNSGNNDKLTEKTIGNMAWRFAERSGVQGVSLVVSIILARLLAPEAYGTVALITVFTTILQVFVDSGLGNALIQKKNADELDFSTVFVFNVGMCITVYAILYAAAPYIAEFYGNPELTILTRVLGLNLLVSGVKNIQQAYVSCNLLFKRFFYATLVGTVVGACIGVAMAYAGYGIWALVAQQIANTVVGTVMLFIKLKWCPRVKFSWDRFKGLFSFGWKLLVSALLDSGYNNLRQLVVGKFYTTDQLAFYNQGDRFPNVIITNINSSISSVLLPVMSRAQDDVNRVKGMTRRAIRISSYVIWPIMIGLALCAEPITIILLTEKWLPCVPYLQMFCFTYALWPIHTANLNAINAMGRSDLLLVLELTKKLIGIAGIVVSIKYGVFAMAATMVVTDTICGYVNMFPNKKLLDYSWLEQIKDLAPAFLLSLIMGGLVYSLTFLRLSPLVTLVLQIPLGISVYVVLSWRMRVESFQYILGMVNLKLKRQTI